MRDEEYLNRYWMHPGDAGFEHRIGGLEKKEGSGNLTYDPLNHERMTQLRAEKVQRVAGKLPDQQVYGADSGELLIVGWGSTHGSIHTALDELMQDGEKGGGFRSF